MSHVIIVHVNALFVSLDVAVISVTILQQRNSLRPGDAILSFGRCLDLDLSNECLTSSSMHALCSSMKSLREPPELCFLGENLVYNATTTLALENTCYLTVVQQKTPRH